VTITGALEASQQAHRLGTLDALFFFHTGMIEMKLGMNVEAKADITKALAINPYFSVLYETPGSADPRLAGEPRVRSPRAG